MKRLSILALTTALALASPAVANNGKGNGNNGGNPAFGANGFCPPGLANRNPPCVPPGQAAKYGIGDRITGDYRRIDDPLRYGLDDALTYLIVEELIYAVDPDTREVLTIIGLASALLN